ncbi:MAG TPA: hypothetical protein VGQ53_02410 [Chitinophagaceae bacterium]|jgi:hypothetical protein|nr:hypothetical protein [Chitinophagaceae bacterium]
MSSVFYGDRAYKKNPRWAARNSIGLHGRLGYFTGFGSGRLDVKGGQLVLPYQHFKAKPQMIELFKL